MSIRDITYAIGRWWGSIKDDLEAVETMPYLDWPLWVAIFVPIMWLLLGTVLFCVTIGYFVWTYKGLKYLLTRQGEKFGLAIAIRSVEQWFTFFWWLGITIFGSMIASIMIYETFIM
ncbi:hypothetical protein D1823_02305 [Ruegeria sp. AD91A]|uniref:hypothetical protein n=1 Tax=Ruegeria sp. AD91A TaxID=2293862 RepID=UPI000E4D15FB|nr:hypothetical protein [Ruegeria sp. AD91A]AXT25530.1 hypothetical protein D1823_02305 [Ruegeria sp. AD91A]